VTLDIFAVGTAIADKYATVTISDATVVGGTAIRESTFLPPNNLAVTPAVIVDLPSGQERVPESTYDQQDEWEFDVYFLLDKASGDIPRVTKAAAKWIMPLRNALHSGNQLGITGVLKARPVSWKFEQYEYGGEEYDAWHLVVRVWTEDNDPITA
jgi:hypothetical protein